MDKTKLLTLTLTTSLAFIGCSINTQPGEGQKVGQIVKVAEVGILSKTWEAEIMRGGFSGGSGTVGASFHFTIERREDAIKAQVYMEKQTEVLLKYRTQFITGIFSSESDGHFLESLEPVVKNQ